MLPREVQEDRDTDLRTHCGREGSEERLQRPGDHADGCDGPALTQRSGCLKLDRPLVDQDEASPIGGSAVLRSSETFTTTTVHDVEVPNLGVPGFRVSIGGVAKSIHSPEYAVVLRLLRQLRLDAGMRQVDLADRLGRLQTFVSRYEVGDCRLDVIELRTICQELETDLPTFVAKLEQALADLQPKRARSARRV